MNGKHTLYVDQYGNKYFANSAKDLKKQIGKGAISAMYADKKDGSTVKVGYIIGEFWCRAFAPIEIAFF